MITKIATVGLSLLVLVAVANVQAAEESFIGMEIPHKAEYGSRMIGGLGWRADLDKNGLRLGKSMHICFGGWGYQSRKQDWADIGLFRPSQGVGQLEVKDASWATSVVSAGDFKAYVTRLSPAVLLEFGSQSLRMFEGARVSPHGKRKNQQGGTRVPRFFAVKTAGRTTIKEREELASLSINDLAGGWMLAWYGAESRLLGEAGPARQRLTADCPVLLIFGSAPQKAAGDGTGITLTFPGAGPHRIAVVAPLGERLVRAIPDEKHHRPTWYLPNQNVDNETVWLDHPPTETWTANVPEEVIKQCEWWSEHLKQFPVGATEEHNYDPASDTVSVTGRVTFVELAKGGKPFAPVPTMVALAVKEKFSPLQMKGKLTDSPVDTKWGPYCGIEGADTYSYSIKGLGKYAFEAREVAGAGKEPEEIRQAFESQLDKVIETGIMSPWFFNVCTKYSNAGYAKDRHRLVWGNPGENLYFIGQCMEIADPARRKKLMELADAWQAKYPAEEVIHMPARADKARENYTVHYGRWKLPARDRNFHYLNSMIPCDNAYYLADYYERAGKKPSDLPGILDRWAALSDWASLGFLRAPKGRIWQKIYGSTLKESIPLDVDIGRGSVDDINRLFIGSVGHIRMARMLGKDKEVERGMYFLGRAAILRYAMTRWKYYLYENKYLAAWGNRLKPRQFCGKGIHGWTWDGPDDDAHAFFDMDEFHVSMRSGGDYHVWRRGRIIPFMHMTPELGRFLSDHLKGPVTAFVNKVADGLPEWYITYADCTLAGEQYQCYLEDAHQMFLARAWVMSESPRKLWKYADLPYLERGDWYYIHKLAETIKAYRGVTWHK